MEYDPTNETGTGTYATNQVLTFSVGGGTAGVGFGLDLDAPDGSTFRPGTNYTGDAPDATIFGELQLGEPTTGALVSGAHSIAWPTVPVNTTSAALLPVWVRNTGSYSHRVGTAIVTGPDARDFTVLADSCSHHTLTAHASCSLAVAFTPHAAGVRTATVTVPVGTQAVTTALSGTGPAGRTLLRLNSEPGDSVGQGRSYLVTDAQARVVVSGGRYNIQALVDDRNFSVIVSDRPDALSLGTHHVDESVVNAPDLHVSADGRGCGFDADGSTYTVRQLSFDAQGRPAAFDITFDQICDDPGSSGRLTGEIAYRATNHVYPATGPFILPVGASIAAGSKISNGLDSSFFDLAVSTAGRAELSTAAGVPLWATPAGIGTTHDRLTVTAAGTLALVTAAGTILWQTPVATRGIAHFAVLQTDGNLVRYNSHYQPIWATGTQQPVN